MISNPPTGDDQTGQEVAKAIDNRLHTLKTHDGSGIMRMETFKLLLAEDIAKLITQKQLEAYKHGLMTGAMPKVFGRPIAEEYIARLTKQKGK